MIWLQGALSLMVWLAAGWWLGRRSLWMSGPLSRLGRSARMALGSVGILLSGAIMVGGGVLVIQSGGIRSGSLTAWGWAATTALGSVFVGLQAIGAGAVFSMLGMKETARTAHPSNHEEGPS
jgi:hypothetical protein